MKILFVEDEKITRLSFTNLLLKEGYEVESCDNVTDALRLFKADPPDVVVTDLRLPDLSGVDLLKAVKEIAPGCFVIIMTGYGTIDSAVTAIRSGAYDYLTKPLSPERFLSMISNINTFIQLQNENSELRQIVHHLDQREIVGSSPTIRKLLQTIESVAPLDYTVLIEGESGTGKELVARAIHQLGARKDFPFIPISCAAIPESLLESELFGHEKGSFTGAVKRHIGYFERANSGTVFIDDIDDFPMPLQVKLLRVLQEREIIRVGGNEAIPINVRVVCATKVNLLERVKNDRFREDLFYRLNIVPLRVPPLRERKEDILPLLNHFFVRKGGEEKIKHMTPELINRLLEYDWPGNVRQLENVVERIIAISEMGSVDEFFSELLPGSPQHAAEYFGDGTVTTYDDYMQQRERRILEWALRRTRLNVSAAAKLLKMARSTLRSRLDKLEISYKDSES